MSQSQPAILGPAPPQGRFLALGLIPGTNPRPALARLARARQEPGNVIGVGAPLALVLRAPIAGLRPFPALDGPVAIPSTQGALAAFFGGDDQGELLQRGRRLLSLVGDAFRIDEEVQTFLHGGGRDLTGFVDGTENPKDDAAVAAAIVTGKGEGLDGSSFLAAQRWIHDLPRLEGLDPPARDLVIGRRLADDTEIADAPPSAHVKRAAQESFTPPAFMLRRSMPWGNIGEHGLHFMAYAASLDPFEHVLRRMAGLDDGIIDALFSFSRPVSGGSYWCPPSKDSRLDLSALQVA